MEILFAIFALLLAVALATNETKTIRDGFDGDDEDDY